MYCLFFFFFQAEDGIRDLVRSRGLGDVYKRQQCDEAVGGDDHRAKGRGGIGRRRTLDAGLVRGRLLEGVAGRLAGARVEEAVDERRDPVSYTHLKLPAGDLEEVSVVVGLFKKKNEEMRI